MPADARQRERVLRPRVIAAVAAAWIVIDLVVATQSVVADALMGKPRALVPAVLEQLVQSLPWIPVTLCAIMLGVRFPLRRDRWLRYLPLHLAAAVGLAFTASLLLLLEFWMLRGRFPGLGALMSSAMTWTVMRLSQALLTYGSILAVTQWVRSQRRARERELHVARMQEQLARANLQALNAQIRPHFLFNTLHAIGQMWRSGDADDADAMLDHLGTLYRSVQSSTSRVSVPLAQEVEIARAYLAIEQMRFKHRLQVSVETDADCLECEVPPLVLQPFLENAVRHGISATSSAGRIDVSVRRENGWLRMLVSDDGPGPDTPARNPGSGMGIANTRSRLEQMYGGSARLDVSGRPGRGTRVTIHIPWAAVQNV